LTGDCGTCLVRVWASEEALDTLAASEDVEFVEDVTDGEN
jgi:ferredoxin